MNAHPNTRSFARSRLSFIAILLATLGMVFSFVPSTAVQVAPPSSLAIQFFDAIGGGNALFLISPDAVLHTPEGEFIGRAGLSQFGNELESSFADVEFSTRSVEYAHPLVIVSFTLTGINTGSYHGTEANCAGIAAQGVAVLMVSEGDQCLSGAMSQYIEGAGAGVANVVTEQWIGYDSDLIASQISAFNELDPSTRPGCSDLDLPQAAPDYEPAPSCLTPTLCETPW